MAELNTEARAQLEELVTPSNQVRVRIRFTAWYVLIALALIQYAIHAWHGSPWLFLDVVVAMVSACIVERKTLA